MTTVYDVQQLYKRYDAKSPYANEDITLQIMQGEVYGLLGPNGAGKSTFIRQLAGLSRPTSGVITLFNQDLVAHPEVAANLIAVQPQGSSLPVQSNPAEVIEITGRLRGLSHDAARAAMKELLERFGLTKHANKRIVQLSGGLRRLVNIAATLIAERPVLILDEPTNDLDPEIRRTIWQCIRDTARNGSTILLVTHNVVEAEQALDRVAIIKNGRILAEGTPSALKGKVENKVRMELTLREGAAAFAFPQGVEMTDVGKNRHVLIVEREDAEKQIAYVMNQFHVIEDFRILTPTLEDVYIQISGGERLVGSAN
ncbi:ABC transporter ATP-binding protein [Paenibacillus sp. CCS19]|uniref:ABC transporter ATP-binding protein n=1 Tax=Paenibacillus sp. CCS19 TaxID=3158387 RepID=UPI00255DA75E|nr:ABC transporter ATP-binding protein [Paenibacillus cellulosilyticus]GMK39945.1 ABC transporter ATP-binding protein [Paenibacillus cellulosilyticus]